MPPTHLCKGFQQIFWQFLKDKQCCTFPYHLCKMFLMYTSAVSSNPENSLVSTICKKWKNKAIKPTECTASLKDCSVSVPDCFQIPSVLLPPLYN